MSSNLLSHLLVADPGLIDPTLEKSVIFLIDETSPDNPVSGYMGVDICGKNQQDLADVIQEITRRRKFGPNKTDAFPVYQGGPHFTDYLFFMHGPDYESDLTTKITDNVRYTIGADNGIVLDMSSQRKRPKDIFTAAGVHVLGTVDLWADIGLGAWHVLPYDSELVFAKDRSNIWGEALARAERQAERQKADFGDLSDFITARPC